MRRRSGLLLVFRNDSSRLGQTPFLSEQQGYFDSTWQITYLAHAVPSMTARNCAQWRAGGLRQALVCNSSFAQLADLHGLAVSTIRAATRAN